MVEQKQSGRVENEGSLARSWEQRLKPRMNPSPKRRRRVMAPWVRPATWIFSLWGGALIASLLAIHVLTMSFQYNQLSQQYTALTRQNQALSAAVATKDTPQALARDAVRLKVPLVEPRIVTKPTVRVQPVQSRHLSLVGQMTAWIRGLNHAQAR